MARPLRIEFDGAFYHVTARGNERKDIYKSRWDRERFLSYLESATQRYSAVIHGYCLMTNHYHLLVETPLGNLSKIMQHINSSYTTYYNVKRKRSGHLLQGRYKAILVEADSYACELSRYMHLNPVRAGMCALPDEYPWTSYHAYVNTAERPDWLTTRYVLGYFTGPEKDSYRHFVEEMVGKKYTSPLDKVIASTVLGGDDFVADILERYVEERPPEREIPALHQLLPSWSPEAIHAAAAEIFTEEKKARKAAIFICHRYSGATLADIAGHFQLSLSGVTQASHRFAEEIEHDAELSAKVVKLKAELNV